MKKKPIIDWDSLIDTPEAFEEVIKNAVSENE